MEELCLMIPKSGTKFEEKIVFYFKNDKNLARIRTLENVKIGIFRGSFCPKQKTYELQTYRGVISNDTEE